MNNEAVDIIVADDAVAQAVGEMLMEKLYLPTTTVMTTEGIKRAKGLARVVALAMVKVVRNHSEFANIGCDT
jgi:hypothetical protein